MLRLEQPGPAPPDRVPVTALMSAEWQHVWRAFWIAVAFGCCVALYVVARQK